MNQNISEWSVLSANTQDLCELTSTCFTAALIKDFLFTFLNAQRHVELLEYFKQCF